MPAYRFRDAAKGCVSMAVGSARMLDSCALMARNFWRMVGRAWVKDLGIGIEEEPCCGCWGSGSCCGETGFEEPELEDEDEDEPVGRFRVGARGKGPFLIAVAMFPDRFLGSEVWGP